MIRLSFFKRDKGLTIFEVLVGGSISAIAGVLLLLILVQNNGLFMQQTSKISQGLGLNDASSLISDDLRLAAGIINAVTFEGQSYTSGAAELLLKIPAIDSSGNIIDQTYDTVIYNTDSSTPAILRRRVVPDALSSRLPTNQVLVTDLATVVFTYINNNGTEVTPSSASKVNFTLTLKKSPFSANANSTKGEVGLRNN